MYVKQALIYALDTSTLNDVSNLLNKSVSQKTFEDCSNIHGIIMTEEITSKIFRRGMLCLMAALLYSCSTPKDIAYFQDAAALNGMALQTEQ